MKRKILNQAFISHSQKDYSGKKYISLLCSVIGLTPKMVEYEEMSEEEANDIKKWISKSKYIFVLLSDHVLDSYFTQNWIAFEMGVAFDKNIPIFLFENLNKPVDFPVPYLDFHIHYLDRSNDIEYVKGCFDNIEDVNGDYLTTMTCSECEKFWIMRSDVIEFACPYCLEELETNEDDDDDEE